MAPVTLLLFGSVFFAVTLVSGNNLSACLGAAVGARIISQKFAVLLGAAGFAIGLLTLGHDMTGATQKLLASSSKGGALLESEILLTMIFVFILGQVLRVPLSNSMSLTGVLVGISIGNNLPLDHGYVASAVALWVVAPLVAIGIMFVFVRVVIARAKPDDLWSRLRLYKILIVVASFGTAFASGTNSIALIVAVSGFGGFELIIALAGIIIGTTFLSRGEIKRVGNEILMLRYSDTLFALVTSSLLILFASITSIPLSSTQTLSASVFGAGIAFKNRFISAKPFALIIVGWVVAPLLSLAIGFFLIKT